MGQAVARKAQVGGRKHLNFAKTRLANRGLATPEDSQIDVCYRFRLAALQNIRVLRLFFQRSM